MPATLAQPMPAQQVNSPAALAPKPGETQGQHFERVFRLLATKFPKINTRTVEVIRLWQQSQNDSDLRQEARDRFPKSKFTQYGPRCIFLSHTIPEIAEEVDELSGEVTKQGREGTEYNRKNLQHLVDYANFRIRNAGQFAALSEGHMPTAEEKEAGRPDANVLGYAGPFYIGVFGNAKPQWAIFCDEWIHNEDVAKSEKLQRRSPEVWCKEPIEARTMDPIAMLGAETPRLDSGMNLYAKRCDGKDVMRYSMSMALPGASNTFVPGGRSGKQNYGANDMTPPGTQNGSPDLGQATGQDDPQSPDNGLVDAIIDQLGKLMPSIIQGVQAQLSSANPNDPSAVPSEDDVPGDADSGQDSPRGVDQPIDATSGDANPAGNTPPVGDATPTSAPAASNAPIDDDHAKYAAMSHECGSAYAAGHAAGSRKGRPMTTNYSKNSEAVEARLAQQDARIAAQAQRIADLETEKRDTERYSKVSALAREHEIGDIDEHLRTILDVEDAEFDRYMKALSLAPKKGDMASVEIFDDPDLDVETENYAKRGARSTAKSPSRADIDRYSRDATDAVLRKRRKGQETTFDEELKIIFLANGLPDPTLENV